jgi:hypothetical protein
LTSYYRPACFSREPAAFLTASFVQAIEAAFLQAGDPE